MTKKFVKKEFAMTNRLIHASQRYDRPDKELAAATDTYRDKAPIVTYTEIAERVRVLVDKVWACVRESDCAVTWNTEVLTLVHRERVVTDRPWVSKSGGKGRPLSTPVTVLRNNKTAGLVIIAVIHLPAGVEQILKKNGVSRVAVHAAHARAVRRTVNRLARRYHPTVSIIVGDWNINVRTRTGRVWMRAMFPNWVIVAPRKGTHGPRVIDYAVVRRARAGVAVLPAHRSSDHRAILGVWTPEKPRNKSKK